MVGGWDDGEEPWNNRESLGYNRIIATENYWKLPENERRWRFLQVRDSSFDIEDPYLTKEPLRLERRDGCFVATAVYGNSEVPQVQVLRNFRDTVLMEHPVGRKFVDFYYSGAGKRTADFISEHLPSAIPLIRRGLDVLVERYSAQKR